MLAVSNTSPISNLAAIGRLDLLKAQFPVLWIPTVVAEELKAHPDRESLAAIHAAFADESIKTATPQDTHLYRMLQLQVHRGEAAAIALAADLKADIVVIDEQEGRALAIQAGLSVTGILGVLLKAKRNGAIPSVRSEIQALRAKARFFISTSLETAVLRSAGE